MEDIRKDLVINNRYVLKEYKGSGSFGEVWLAYDKQEDREIAVKIYISLDRQGCDEFLGEYKIASGLKHPNLLVTEHYDVWQNRPFLTMKYCGLGSVANLVGKLSPSLEDERLIWKFIHDVAAGLEFLHNLEPDPIVHQDIKPDNVLQDNDGSFLITDFGISKKVRNTLRSQSTRAQKAGAVAYMAPERFSKSPNPILASDIWSLGVSIYELAEGELPFAGMGGVLLKNGADMAELSNGWTRNLNAIMEFCLAKESWDRGKAHEIKAISTIVLRNDLKANVPLMINNIKEGKPLEQKEVKSEFDPHATNRKVNTQTDEKGDVGTETVNEKTNTHKEKEELTPKPAKSIWKWVIAAAVCLCAIIYMTTFYESPEMKEAKSHVDEYRTIVENCYQLTEIGSESDTKSLLLAKEEYAKKKDLENKYGSILPDVYVLEDTIDIESMLNEKLEVAAKAWSEAAKSQAENLGDYANAIEFYKLSLKLWSDEQVAAEYKKTIKTTAYMKIKDVDFGYNKKDGGTVIYGETLYARSIAYLTPRIKYDGIRIDDAAIGSEQKLSVKIYDSNGSLERGSNSPKGFTYSDTYIVSTDTDASLELSGWGNDYKTCYNKGTYNFELWHDGKRIYRKSFEIK